MSRVQLLPSVRPFPASFHRWPLRGLTVPVDTTSDRDVTPINIQRASSAGVQPVPGQVDVIDLDRFVAVEL